MNRIEVLEDGNLMIKIPMSLRCISGRRKVITPETVNENDGAPHPILAAVARALYWQKKLDTGEMPSAVSISKAAGVDVSYVTRILRFKYLSPRIVRLFLCGTPPPNLTVVALRQALPVSWEEQEKLLLGNS